MDITAYRLRKLREKIGLSQREIAERIGITAPPVTSTSAAQVNRFDFDNSPPYLAFRRTIFSAKMKLTLKLPSMKLIHSRSSKKIYLIERLW